MSTAIALTRSAPLLQALRRAGTAHIYGDTADASELARVATLPDGAQLVEVDGNTANQPLVRKFVEANAPTARAWARDTAAHATGAPAVPSHYAALCARLGLEFQRRFGGVHTWDTSLQLHMDLCDDIAAATFIARELARKVPGALIKVPFAPHLPGTLLLARNLEAEGLRVNLTSTFSARQVAVAALLCNVSRTNIFMGRLNQAFGAALLGEHVCLEAQRLLVELRRRHGVATRLIVASMRAWRTFVDVAGCDAFTAPCAVLADFLAQREVQPAGISRRLETSYADRLGLGPAAPDPQRIARLYRVEPEFIEFLLALRASASFRDLDGEALARRFDGAGFGDFFYAPTAAEWAELQRDKLVSMDQPMAQRLSLDTHFTLRAHADFVQHQRAVDRMLSEP